MVSFWTPIKQIKPYNKTHKNVLEQNKKTTFEETNPNTENMTDFYDTVSLHLDCLQKDAITFGEILKEQRETIETIEHKTEKSDGRLKKTIHKVKNC